MTPLLVASLEMKEAPPAGSEQLPAGHVRKGAHLVRRSHRLHRGQVRRVELIEAGDAEESHGGGDFAF